ncbi:MAG: hypothetical protein MUC36_23300, partial [Planctomycetes bacterium]|nr:hypothetical protein [Planctomycetota bacterium]
MGVDELDAIGNGSALEVPGDLQVNAHLATLRQLPEHERLLDHVEPQVDDLRHTTTLGDDAGPLAHRWRIAELQFHGADAGARHLETQREVAWRVTAEERHEGHALGREPRLPRLPHRPQIAVVGVIVQHFGP